MCKVLVNARSFMTHTPAPEPIRLKDLSACCPEAQADGVPCTALGRNCQECERAVELGELGAPAVDRAVVESPVEDTDERDDSWAV
jgi:hypothetical protein